MEHLQTMSVLVKFFSIVARNRDGSPLFPNEAKIQATTLGEVIAAIPNAFPFSLSPSVKDGKYWVVNSEHKKLNGSLVDLHFVEPRSHLLVRDNADRSTCPKHDLTAVIPFGAYISIGSPIC